MTVNIPAQEPAVALRIAGAGAPPTVRLLGPDGTVIVSPSDAASADQPGTLRFQDVHEPVLYGHDTAASLNFVRGFQNVNAALAGMSDSDAARAVRRLRGTLASHSSDDHGVAFDSRSWLITGRRR